jgi:hypothetical protein
VRPKKKKLGPAKDIELLSHFSSDEDDMEWRDEVKKDYRKREGENQQNVGPNNFTGAATKQEYLQKLFEPVARRKVALVKKSLNQKAVEGLIIDF